MTTPNLKDFDKIAREAERAVLDAASLDALKEARRAYLGRRGLVAQLFDQVPSLPAAQRPEAGRRLNEPRARLERTGTRRAQELQGPTAGAHLAAAALDVPQPGRGKYHCRQNILPRPLEQVHGISYGRRR